MNRPIRRLALVLVVGLALLLVNTTYIQVARGPAYRDDPRNPRVLLERSTKERGTIVDRDGAILAQSIPNSVDPTAFDRSYPLGPAAAHVVGYSSLLFGDRGLEQVYASELRSKEDVTVSDMIAALLGRDLRPQSLITTLDADVQQAADEALGNRRGAVVALDPRTGAVVAYVSHPTFDPARLLGPDAAPVGDALSADPDEPLRDRVVTQTYPPGSTFKAVVTASALDLDLVTPETTFDDVAEFPLPGSTAAIRNFDRGTCDGGGDVELSVAFVRSCNTVFAQLGLLMGPDALVSGAEEFGFNDEIPFDFPVTASMIPPAASFTNNGAALAQTAIGQRDVRATPLQMALVAAAVVNDGVIMEPHLVDAITDADGETVEKAEPREWRRAMTETTAETMWSLMVDVVDGGTGRSAAVPGLIVGGKTGTAQSGSQQPPDVWFIGAARDGDRWLAIAVIVEQGGDLGDDATGGSVAAPIAGTVFDAWSRP